MPPLSTTTIEALAADARVTVRVRGAPDPDGAAVVYWMQRAQRAVDNPALDVAVAVGNLLRKPVVVFFGVNPFVEGANLRHYTFLAEGLADLERGLAARRVGFVLRRHPHHRLLPFLAATRPTLVVGDENPLRQASQWRERIAEEIAHPFWTIDADVVVPSRLIEPEQYAARAIRPRLHRLLPEFLKAGPEEPAAIAWPGTAPGIGAAADILEGLPIDTGTTPAPSLRGGTSHARARLAAFVRDGLESYARRRNDPAVDGTSQLSPYLHFGHIGPREVALAVRDSGADRYSVDAFLEQLIVRRELAVNYVRFNASYETMAGFEPWARQTLRRHQFDRRPHIYSRAQFESASTHDPLWNAAQRQVVATGWMPGYLRMYWAKKILEWSRTPSEALATAIALNDRYQLDGRDASGYANIAWAIGGKHDRPWPPRPVFGTVRAMTFERMIRKFDAAGYVERYGTRHDVAALAALRPPRRRAPRVTS